MAHQYFEINISCALILIICAYKATALIKSKDRRFFAYACISEAALFIFYGVDRLFNTESYPPQAVGYLIDCIMFPLEQLAIMTFIRFESVYIRHTDFSLRSRILLLIPTFVTILLSVSAPFNGLFFTVSEQGIYSRGPLYIVYMFWTFGFILSSSVFALIFSRKTSDCGYRRKEILLSLFGVVSLASALLETLPTDFTLLCVAVTISLLIMMFNLWGNHITTDLDLVIAAVKVAYPITLSVNVSRDEYNLIENRTGVPIPGGNSGIFSEMLTRALNAFPPEDREPYFEAFSREALLEAHKCGQASVTRRHRIYDTNKVGRWNETRVIFVNIKDTTDVMAVVLLKSIEGIMARELELKDARLRAEAANKAKTTFLFNMSHDIRTPMNAIIGFTSMAEKNIHNPAKLKDCLHKVDLSSAHLLSLINDVLDMARIESGNANLELAPVNIRSIGEDIRDMVCHTAGEHGVRFKLIFDGLEDEHAMSNTLRLRQILLNTVTNALKYTKSGGSVTLTVAQSGPPVDNMVKYVFTVADTGIGMTPEFVDHIYDPFSRERTATLSKVEGTGLGMAITKQIVDMLGGDIRVDSTLGEGTTVTITIEMRLMSADGSDGAIEEAVDPDVLKGKHLLLVEDNELNREIAGELLRSFGITVDEAVDGKQAVGMIESSEGCYNLVLMDIQMPVMDGYMAAETIRGLEDPALSKVPIIAMTANAFEEDRQHALDAGMNDHVAKPFNPEVLVKTLCKYVA